MSTVREGFGIISREDIDRVRAATDMVHLVSAHTQLKRSGSRFMGLCPFHAERTPSFSVNAEDCLYHCFGCQESGDCFNFVQKTENLDFAEAVEFLAQRAGIPITRTSSPQAMSRKPMLEALQAAQSWYHELLLNSPEAGSARSYLRTRGYGSHEVRKWKLGWAPDRWDGLQRHLRADQQVLQKAGLVKQSSSGGVIDVQRGRIIFSICNHRGEVIAFGGRALPGAEGVAKYINSPETSLYKKSRELFGLDMAKAAVVDRNEVIIAEGYTDVIGLHEMGFPNAVATCGTALTRAHLERLRRFENKNKGFEQIFLLAFDPDSSGQTAAARIHEWQSEMGLRVEVVDLSEHGDPGDIAENFFKLRQAPEDNAEQLAGIHQIFTQPPQDASGAPESDRLSDATPKFRHEYLQFRVDRALGGSDVGWGNVSSPEQAQSRALAAARVIAEHPDTSVRDKYLKDLSVRMAVMEGELRKEVQRVLPRRRGDGAASQDEPTSVPAAPQDGWRRTEDLALHWVCHTPEQVPEYLDEKFFANTINKDILRALYDYESYDQILAEGNLDADVREKIIRLRVENPTQEADLSNPPEYLWAQLLYNAAIRRHDEITLSLRSAIQDEGTARTENAQLLAELQQALGKVRQENFTLGAAEEYLLPFL